MGSGEGPVPSPQKILGKNNAFSCKIILRFKMHPVQLVGGVAYSG